MLVHCKTKIVCTIGPASETSEVMSQMIRSGMTVARLNFSHGELEWHRIIIGKLRECSRIAGRPLAIMADLPGPKIRIGRLETEPVLLRQGDMLILTTEPITGNAERVHVSLPTLPESVKPGDHLFINDGIIHLEVVKVKKPEVHCRLLVGGELRSRKGVNLPGIVLGISAFTQHDRDCLRFALENGVDAVSQSFVAGPADIENVRNAAAEMGFNPFIIAKIERLQALEAVDAIMHAADGIMIARGDLGVEIPLENIAMVQKELTYRANLCGKPVITATQMLDSMVDRMRPTRAEVTDVANAILDGTDAVMLSEESAMGKYPAESVAMLSRIAAATEPRRPTSCPWETMIAGPIPPENSLVDFISKNVNHAVDHLRPAAVVVPTSSGHTARMISRFKLPLWIAAVTPSPQVCRSLLFSYGVAPVLAREPVPDWSVFSRNWIKNLHGSDNKLVILLQGPSVAHPDANPSMEIILPEK